MPPSRRSQHAALQDGLDRTPRLARHAPPSRRPIEEPAALNEAIAAAVVTALDIDANANVNINPTPRASNRCRQPTQRESKRQ